MPAFKLLTTRSADPAGFPCDNGRIPDVGFSTTKGNGKPVSVSLSFAGSNITDQAKINTYINLQHKCANDTTSGALASALNCGPNEGFVQSCTTLYNCSAPGVVNGTTLGAAQTNGISAHLSLFGGDLSAPAMPCYAANLQESLTNATRDFPVRAAQISGSAPSQKTVKAAVLAIAASVAMGVLTSI